MLINRSKGTGMNVLSNMMIESFLNRNQRIFVIDIGTSYKKLCERSIKSRHSDKTNLPGSQVVEIVKELPRKADEAWP